MDPAPEAPQPGESRDRRTDEQLRRAQRLESLGHLAGGVAHDFNNILGVILGYVELAKMNMAGADPKAVRHLEQALSTLGRARMLADRLLDFVREEPSPADVRDVNETALEVRDLLTETLDRRIKFEVKLGADLPPPPLDADDIRQVVTNLCLNATEAMPGGGELTLDTFALRVEEGDPSGLAPGHYVCLRVRDTGPGVPADLREAIFDPYFTTRPHAHSGLGLWVARGLIERFGGRLDAGGDEHGAVFTAWLPSELAVRPHPEAASTVARKPADGQLDVLVVDDEPGVRDVTRAYLEMDGYRVAEAGTGAEALQMLRDHPGGVQVVFLDHLLPDAQGADLAWQIEGMDAPPRPVSAPGRPGVPEPQDLPAGTRVLAKPFLHDDVTNLLREVLGIVPAPPA